RTPGGKPRQRGRGEPRPSAASQPGQPGSRPTTAPGGRSHSAALVCGDGLSLLPSCLNNAPVGGGSIPDEPTPRCQNGLSSSSFPFIGLLSPSICPSVSLPASFLAGALAAMSEIAPIVTTGKDLPISQNRGPTDVAKRRTTNQPTCGPQKPRG